MNRNDQSKGIGMNGCLAVAVSIIALVDVVFIAAFAQSPGPYAGMQDRSIKALSGDQIADLKAGRGIGLALAAELNGYPGPRHVLELSTELILTHDQKSNLQAMFDAMTAETVSLGETLLAEEQQLDRLFAEKAISEERLRSVTAAIGETQARLRNAHLSYHLRARAILQPAQIQRYAELRGYQQQRDRQHRRHDHQ